MNCKHCGAPLHGSKCDYCGSDYSDYYQITTLKIDKYTHQVDTLAYKVEMPMEYMKSDTQELIEAKIKADMSYQMSKDLLKYMDVETWIDPVRLTQIFGGRIRVARPD